MAIVIDIASPTEPITSAMIKTQLRIDGTEEDDNIDAYLPLARKSVEMASNVTLVEKTVKMQYETPEDRYYLKFDTQESGITAMVYTDSEGEVVTATGVLHASDVPNYVTSDEIPDSAKNIKIVYQATPNVGHPVTAAIVEKMTELLTYNVKTKQAARDAYDAIIEAHGVKSFG